MRMRSLMGLGLVAVLAACGGDDDGGGGGATCEEAAAAVGACGGDITEQQFIDTYCEQFVFPDGCTDAVVAADCEEHELDEPSYFATCFPACGADSSSCNDDGTISVCSDGVMLTASCEGVCEAGGSPYTGTCAAEYMDQQSSTGMDVCWCE